MNTDELLNRVSGVIQTHVKYFSCSPAVAMEIAKTLYNANLLNSNLLSILPEETPSEIITKKVTKIKKPTSAIE